MYSIYISYTNLSHQYTPLIIMIRVANFRNTHQHVYVHTRVQPSPI